MTTYGVVVPTYHRPDALAACLEALAGQHLAPDAVVVVTRPEDRAAAGVAAMAPLHCTVVELDEPGVLAAMVAGARATTTDVVCFTDDDAVAPPTWLAQIAQVLGASTTVGAVGGRDVLIDPDGATRNERRTADVGRTTWFGRHIGNHHRGAGPPRDVEFLKGVNAAYRRQALGLPVGLRGAGAQAHFEVAAGRFARERGWRLVYDPELAVEHHPAPRHGADQREGPTGQAVSDAAYNMVLAIGGLRGLIRVAYATVVGDRGAPGVLRAAFALVQGDLATARRLGPSMRGSAAGGWALLRGRGVRYETFA